MSEIDETSRIEAIERIKLLIKTTQLALDHPFFVNNLMVNETVDNLYNLLGCIGQNTLDTEEEGDSLRERVNLFPCPIDFIFKKPFPIDRPCLIWSSCTRKFAPSGIGSPTKSLLILAKKEMIGAIQNDIALKLQSYYGHPLAWLRVKHIAYCQWNQVEGVRESSLVLECRVY